jgi:hypothetical protein
MLRNEIVSSQGSLGSRVFVNSWRASWASGRRRGSDVTVSTTLSSTETHVTNGVSSSARLIRLDSGGQHNHARGLTSIVANIVELVCSDCSHEGCNHGSVFKLSQFHALHVQGYG